MKFELYKKRKQDANVQRYRHMKPFVLDSVLTAIKKDFITKYAIELILLFLHRVCLSKFLNARQIKEIRSVSFIVLSGELLHNNRYDYYKNKAMTLMSIVSFVEIFDSRVVVNLRSK
jgi:hypothetical protein